MPFITQVVLRRSRSLHPTSAERVLGFRYGDMAILTASSASWTSAAVSCCVSLGNELAQAFHNTSAGFYSQYCVIRLNMTWEHLLVAYADIPTQSWPPVA